jgi:hypothetical protein
MHGFTSFEFNITRSLLGGTGAAMLEFIYPSIGASYIKIFCAVLGLALLTRRGTPSCFFSKWNPPDTRILNPVPRELTLIDDQCLSPPSLFVIAGVCGLN